MKDGNGVVQPVMQACGHDIHVTCLLAAAEAMVNMRAFWKGTLILVFQPAEELGDGAKAMVEDGLYKKVPIPDVVLGQHVMPDRAGRIGNRTGAMLAASDSLKITLFGRGGHASMPSKCIDPIVMAAAVVMKLQTIVSRELDPKEFAVLTIGSLQAGSAENVIADRAEMKVNVRTADSKIKAKVLAAIERIIKSECEASAAPLPPLIEKTSSFPVTYNDEGITRIVQSAFSNFFGKDFNPEMPFVNGSEDFSYLGTSIDRPTCFWMIGGTDPKIFDKAEKEGKLDLLPVNHSALFAPVMQPTIKVGVDALTLAAMRFLEA
ncbi:MAG: hypothetical protein MMC33_008823 [Icmadophila ericetorum]|nr:hypothetical protein [Icmadophila ericetorum]